MNSATSMSSRQSEKCVTSMLMVCVSYATYLRGIFDDRHYINVTPQENDGPELPQISDSQGNIVPIKMLTRGASYEGNAVLDWLHYPVTDAIRLNYLDAVVFGVVTDREHPETFLESYTFKFNYYGVETGLTIEEQTEALLKRFIAETQELPDLPSQRYLSMKMVVNDNAPADFAPAMFRQCNKIPDTAPIIACGSVAASYHHISIEIRAPTALQIATQPQPETEFACMCGCHKQLEYSDVLVCSECHRGFHRVCHRYPFRGPVDKFRCFSCYGFVNSPQLQLLIGARKILAMLQQRPEWRPASVLQTVKKFGLNMQDPHDQQRVKEVIKALTYLLNNRLIRLTQRFNDGMTPYEVDVAGIQRFGRVITKGTYHITTASNMEAARKVLDPAGTLAFLERARQVTST